MEKNIADTISFQGLSGRECLECGKGIISKRKDKRFCSNTCRAKHSAKNKPRKLSGLPSGPVKFNNPNMIDEVIAHYKYLYQKQLDRSEVLQGELDNIKSKLANEASKNNGGLAGLLNSDVGQQLLVSLVPSIAPSIGRIMENITGGMQGQQPPDYLSSQPDDIKNLIVFIATNFNQIPDSKRSETLQKISEVIKWGMGRQAFDEAYGLNPYNMS